MRKMSPALSARCLVLPNSHAHASRTPAGRRHTNLRFLGYGPRQTAMATVDPLRQPSICRLRSSRRKARMFRNSSAANMAQELLSRECLPYHERDARVHGQKLKISYGTCRRRLNHSFPNVAAAYGPYLQAGGSSIDRSGAGRTHRPIRQAAAASLNCTCAACARKDAK
jgi:hypothetical protein